MTMIREMYADARRKGYTVTDMIRNHAAMMARKAPAATPAELAEFAEEANWLAAVTPADDFGILSWKWAPWPRGRLQCSLVTLNGETVAKIGAGTVARNFGWTLFKPQYWIIADDQDALDARNMAGQDATETYCSGLPTRAAAAKSLVGELHKRSIGLFGVDELMIPDFKIPERN